MRPSPILISLNKAPMLIMSVANPDVSGEERNDGRIIAFCEKIEVHVCTNL